jgi:hypothetical protein
MAKGSKSRKYTPEDPNGVVPNPQPQGFNTALPSDESGVPRTPPQTGVFEDQAGESQLGVQPTYWQKFWSQAGSDFSAAPSMALGMLDLQGSLIQEGIMSGQNKLTPDQANKLYPGLPEPFTHSVYPDVAKLIFDENNKKKRLQAWTDRGPELGTGARFAAGAFTALDPLNIMGGFAAGEVTGGLGIARGLKGGLRGIGAVFGENLAVNTAGTLPGLAVEKVQQQKLASGYDIGANVVGGAALGTGLHLALDAAFGRAANEAQHISAAEHEKNLKAAIEQHEAGAKIDMTPAETLRTVKETGLPAKGIPPEHTYLKIDDPRQVYYYTPVDPQSQWVGASKEFGGITGSDNLQLAHNLAPESHIPGKVIQSEITDNARVVDADQPVSTLFEGLDKEQAIEKIEGILGKGRRAETYAEIFKKVIQGEGTVGDVYRAFENLPHNQILPANEVPLATFRKVADGLGIDVVSFRGELEGKPLDNRILVLNDQALNPVDIHDVNPASVPSYDQHAQAALSDQVHEPIREREYDPTLIEKTTADSTKTVEQIQTQADDYVKQLEQNALKDLEERAKANPDVEEHLSEINAKHKSEKQFAESVKMMAECLGTQFT